MGSASSGCVAVTASGNVSNPTPNTLQMVMGPGAAGYYNFRLSALLNASVTNTVCNFRFTDGTTSFGAATAYATGSAASSPILMGTVYFPAFTSKTITLQASATSGTSCLVNNDIAGRDVEWSVDYSSSVNQQAVRMNNSADLMGTVFYSGKTTCPVNSLPADGTAVSRSTYSALFNNISTTFGVGDGSTTFNVPNLSGVFVRGTGSQTIGGISYTGVLGTAQTDQFQDHTHVSAGSNYMYYNGSGGATGYTATGAGQIGLSSSSGAVNSGRYGAETRPANIGMTPCIWYVSNPAPLLVGGVTSASAGLERVERVSFGTTSSTDCTASPCAYVKQSGSWVSSVTRSSAGQYVVNFAAGMFSDVPVCTCSAFQTGANTLFCSISLASTSSVTVYSRASATNAATDSVPQVICMGAR